jgi:hypothetical protein
MIVLVLGRKLTRFLLQLQRGFQAVNAPLMRYDHVQGQALYSQVGKLEAQWEILNYK